MNPRTTSQSIATRAQEENDDHNEYLLYQKSSIAYIVNALINEKEKRNKQQSTFHHSALLSNQPDKATANQPSDEDDLQKLMKEQSDLMSSLYNLDENEDHDQPDADNTDHLENNDYQPHHSY